MDNILKVLLGVLGVAALLALLVPSGDPIAPLETPVAAPGAEAGSPAPASSENPQVEIAETSNENDSEDFQIGEPVIDGNPMQSDFGMPIGAPQPDPNASNNDVGGQQVGGIQIPNYGNASAPQPDGDNGERGQLSNIQSAG